MFLDRDVWVNAVLCCPAPGQGIVHLVHVAAVRGDTRVPPPPWNAIGREHRPIAALELSRGGCLPAERRFELSSGDLSCRAVLLLCVSALQPR